MKKKIISIFRVIYILITIALCLGYIYILLSGFFVGGYAVCGDNGLKYRIMYILLAVAFPTAVFLMYHYIEYLQRKICKLEQEIEKLRKDQEDGTAMMCQAMEDMRNQTLKEGMKEVALRMLAAGKYALEEIADISGLSLDEVKQLISQ